MSDLTFNLTREKAAEILGVSTRTIDRYIKSGKISYKKVANKVLLAKEEIDELQKDFALLNQRTEQGETISGGSMRDYIDDDMGGVETFKTILTEKDKMLEGKNNMIFVLQKRIGELENQIKHMVALPDHTNELQKALMEKEKLETQLSHFKKEMKNEKIKSTVSIAIFLIFAIIVIVFVMNGF